MSRVYYRCTTWRFTCIRTVTWNRSRVHCARADSVATLTSRNTCENLTRTAAAAAAASLVAERHSWALIGWCVATNQPHCSLATHSATDILSKRLSTTFQCRTREGVELVPKMWNISAHCWHICNIFSSKFDVTCVSRLDARRFVP